MTLKNQTRPHDHESPVLATGNEQPTPFPDPALAATLNFDHLAYLLSKKGSAEAGSSNNHRIVFEATIPPSTRPRSL